MILADTVVRAGATVTRALVDRDCELRSGAVVGSADVDLSDADANPIVGRDAVVSTVVGAGQRLPPGTTA